MYGRKEAMAEAEKAGSIAVYGRFLPYGQCVLVTGLLSRAAPMAFTVKQKKGAWN